MIADTDEDGLNDGDEVDLGGDPLKADSDGDGMEDGAEVTSGRNPTLNEPAALAPIIQMMLDDGL